MVVLLSVRPLLSFGCPQIEQAVRLPKLLFYTAPTTQNRPSTAAKFWNKDRTALPITVPSSVVVLHIAYRFGMVLPLFIVARLPV